MCKFPYRDTFVCLRCLHTRHMATSLETEVLILGTCYYIMLFFEGKGA